MNSRSRILPVVGPAAVLYLLGDRAWGIGLLGFAPQALLDEQLAIATRFGPRYAIIAGGRPDQAVHLERAGVATYLHVPSANLIPGFLAEGARRFIFEGRECGGHIGPLSSFVLWSTMVDKLTDELGTGKVPAGLRMRNSSSRSSGWRSTSSTVSPYSASTRRT